MSVRTEQQLFRSFHQKSPVSWCLRAGQVWPQTWAQPACSRVFPFPIPKWGSTASNNTVSHRLNIDIEDPCKITDTVDFCVKTLLTEWVMCQHIMRLTGQAHIQTPIQAVTPRYVIYGKDCWNREAWGFGLWLGEWKQNSMLSSNCIWFSILFKLPCSAFSVTAVNHFPK